MSIKGDACMIFCDEMKPVNLETDAMEQDSRASSLQARDVMTCHREEAPDNNIRIIAFGCKSLSAAEMKKQQHRKTGIRYTPWFGKVSSLLFFLRVKYSN